jgi:hypothetical protein
MPELPFFLMAFTGGYEIQDPFVIFLFLILLARSLSDLLT